MPIRERRATTQKPLDSTQPNLNLSLPPGSICTGNGLRMRESIENIGVVPALGRRTTQASRDGFYVAGIFLDELDACALQDA